MSDEGHGGLDGWEEAAEAADILNGTHPLFPGSGEDIRKSERDALLERWGRVKRAMAGTVVHCPVCSRSFRKLRASHVFCRHKGRGNCKDRFWNTVNDERRERAIIMGRG